VTAASIGSGLADLLTGAPHWAIFTVIIWCFKDRAVDLLIRCFPGDDATSLQMRVSLFHVVFNVSTTCLLLPFVTHLVRLSQMVIKDKRAEEDTLALKYVDDRLLKMPSVALMQVKKEINYMMERVKENIGICFVSMETGSDENHARLVENEKIINFTNSALTNFLIKFSASGDQIGEAAIGSYFHVLNDLERIGDHAENFHEIGL